MKTRYNSEQQFMKDALEVQDACNLSGVLNAFLDGVRFLHEHKRELGTGDIRRHPAVVLFASKVDDLCGCGQLFSQAYEACQNAMRLTKQDLVRLLGIAESGSWDYSLPQPWLNMLRDKHGFDYQTALWGFIWSYDDQAGLSGRPMALTEEANSMLRVLNAKDGAAWPLSARVVNAMGQVTEERTN